MRVKISVKNLLRLFNALKSNNYSIDILSQKLNVSKRTVSNWRRGNHNLPSDAFYVMCELVNIDPKNFNPQYIDEIAQKQLAGTLGGKAYWRKYTKLGTRESRFKGGAASYKARAAKNDDIFAKIEPNIPEFSSRLAEFIGICMGDGGVTKYQVTISFNSETDKDFMMFVTSLANELFGLQPYIQKKKHARCSNLVFSSISLVEFLVSIGLPIGDKIRAGIDIPNWVMSDNDYSTSCIRGLFDTDGSIFQEIHKINGKKYAYPRLSLVNMSQPLLRTVRSLLLDKGINSKIRSGHSVVIERFTDINNYFRIIGSSNKKHLNRFARFGGVG